MPLDTTTPCIGTRGASIQPSASAIQPELFLMASEATAWRRHALDTDTSWPEAHPTECGA